MEEDKKSKWPIVLIIIGLLLLALPASFLFGFGTGWGAREYCGDQTAIVQPDQQSKQSSDPTLGLTAEQQKIADLQVSIGLKRGRSLRDIKIAIMTGSQESNNRNLSYGHADSLGVYQQRPSQGWGSAKQILNPVYAINKFYSVLETIKNRASMSLMDAAIAVQRPSRAAYLSKKNNFNSWESRADAILKGIKQDNPASDSEVNTSDDTEVTCESADTTGSNGGDVQALIAKAQEYAWVKGKDWQAGGGIQKGAYNDAVKLAVRKGWHVGGDWKDGNDCQGFMNILMRTSGFEPDWPNQSTAGLADAVDRLPGWKKTGVQRGSFDTSKLRPGNVLMTPNKGHVLLYIGKVAWTDSQFIEAANPRRAPYTMGTTPSFYSSGYVVLEKSAVDVNEM